MKYIFITIIAALLSSFCPLSSAKEIDKEIHAIMVAERTAEKISGKYRVDEKLARKIAKLARKYEHPVFPRYADIIGIITVESAFDPRAKNAGCVGLMQMSRTFHKSRVRRPSDLYIPEENIRAGAEYLRELHQRLGSRKAAIMAFNLGESWYRSGRRNAVYYQKVDSASRLYGA